MGCSSCGQSNGTPNGCKNNGLCSTGGCNKMNTYDWLSKMDIHDPVPFHLVEVSFNNGARKDFYETTLNFDLHTGDTVVVDTGSGYDVGMICLSGELVRLQMKKKKIPTDRIFNSVIRKANQRDLEKLTEARDLEVKTMVKARTIARTLDLEMKIGDVEYQGDKRKATFYYTADGRVDFRELVRHYAKEFRVKIEMRQIGSRQESARIGGIGSCGRELCCSTWLSDFRSVTTSAARYQNIAINQAKLSGQCGRLKCCLNYELDTYLEALSTFPENVEILKSKKGSAILLKTDIFKGLMYYMYDNNSRGPVISLHKDRVKEIKEMNMKGEVPDEFALPVEDDNLNEMFAKDFDLIEVERESKRSSKQRRSKQSRRRKSRTPRNAQKNKSNTRKPNNRKKS